MSKNKDLKGTLGANIAKLRKKRGFTQEEFAEKIMLSASALSDIETGNSYPKYDTITKIIETLNVEAHKLFMNSNTSSKEQNYKDTLELLNNLKDNEIKMELLHKITMLIDMME